MVKLKGLDPKARYWLWCEDGSIVPHQASGNHLMGSGLPMTLPQSFSSDIVFLQDAAAGKPEDLVEPGEFKLMSATPEADLFSVTAELAWIPSEHGAAIACR